MEKQSGYVKINISNIGYIRIIKKYGPIKGEIVTMSTYKKLIELKYSVVIIDTNPMKDINDKYLQSVKQESNKEVEVKSEPVSEVILSEKIEIKQQLIEEVKPFELNETLSRELNDTPENNTVEPEVISEEFDFTKIYSFNEIRLLSYEQLIEICKKFDLKYEGLKRKEIISVVNNYYKEKQ